MPIGGLIKGAPGPCIGIVGYDVFRAAVLTLPPPPRGDGARGPVRLSLADPAGYQDDPAAAVHWQVRLMCMRRALSALLHDVCYRTDKGRKALISTGGLRDDWAQELRMLANLPHVLAHFNCGERGDAAQHPEDPPAPASAAMFLLVSAARSLCPQGRNALACCALWPAVSAPHVLCVAGL